MSDTPPEAGAEQAAPVPAQQPDREAQATEASQDSPGPDALRGKQPRQLKPSVVVRYGLMRRTGQFAHNLDFDPGPGTKVVVRTERGVELGEVIASVCRKTCYGCVTSDTLSEYLGANGPGFPFRRDGKVLRLANPQDVIDHRHLESSAREEAVFCREQIRQLGLNMKLVTVEHLLGGERIIFYFSAVSRVDFRELVRRLAAQYRTRIEMRQVGARDEARLVADLERCGRRCCCQQFIKDLKPISMRMAKTQKATLDPSKISGRCGRLMCCLRFEDTAYEELRRKLPKKNIWVRTEEVVGRVIDTQILTQLVRLECADHTEVVVANESIIERDVDPSGRPGAAKPPETGQLEQVGREIETREQPDSASKAPGDAGPAEGGPPIEQAEAQSAPPAQKKKRRRRPRSRPGASQGDGARQKTPKQGAAAQVQSPKQHGSPAKRKKRRRRNKKTSR